MKFTKSIFFIGCLVGGLGAAALPLLLGALRQPATAESRLLPFQGRLTDAAGNGVGDGAKVVEFKMYDAPTGGNVKWAGEVHKLSVNGGLVNTMLGSKASLGSVDFAAPTFLQVTVDANGDGAITAADPPLLPRQGVVPSVYAAVAGQLQYIVPAAGGNPASVASAGWDAVFDNGRPDTGKIAGAKLATDSITAAQLAPNAVETSEIKDNAVTAAKLAPDVSASLLIPDSITATQLANNSVDSGAVIDGEIKSSDIAAGAITASKVTDMQITSSKLDLARASFAEVKGANENGGIGIPGGWTRRVFNRENNQSNGAIELEADWSFVLAPGVYLVTAASIAGTVNSHQCAIRDTDAPAGNMTLLGTTQHASGRYWDSYGATIASHLNGFISVEGASRRFELVHFIGSSMSSFGFQISNLGTHNNQNIAAGTNPQPSVYAQMSILKIQ